MSNTKSAESTLSEPIFNRQALVRLILPLLAEQFLSVSMGMADTLMVSGVGEAAVSSVSLVDSLNILIIQILSALATGGAVISSQYLGRRDGEKAAKSAAQLYTPFLRSAPSLSCWSFWCSAAPSCALFSAALMTM